MAVLAAVRLPILAELLVRDPSIRMVLSGSKAVDYYVRNAYPWLRVIRVDNQRLRLPAKLLVAWWAARRMRRRTPPTRVYLLDAYFCAALIAAVRWSYVTDLVVNRYVDPEDYLREHAARNAPRRLALALMRNVLKLPVTYYSWGKGRWLDHIVGLSSEFLAGAKEFVLGRKDCDLGLLKRVTVSMGRGPHLVWMLSGWEHRLSADFPAVYTTINRHMRRCGYHPVIKEHPTSGLPRGVQPWRTRRIPRYVPGDLIAFPDRTIILGMFTTALTTHEGSAVCSIAKLCRPKDQALYELLTDEVRRLSESVRFVASIDELMEVARRNVAPKQAT